MTADVATSADVHLGRVGRFRPADATAWAAAGIGAAAWLWHAVVVLRGYFYQDDFVYIDTAAHTTPTPAHLFQPYHGNVMPGQFLLAWVVTRIAPLGHAVAVLPVLALAAVALVLMWSCLVGLGGRRWVLLVPFTVFALSPAIFLPTVWWAYSLELMPLLVALLAAVRSQLAFLRTGTLGHALAALGWTAVGLLCWDKAVLIPIVVFGVTVLLAPRTLRPYWTLWLGYVALIGAYSGTYLLITRHDTGTVPLRAHDIPSLAEVMVGRTFLPELLGGPWRSAAGPTSWLVGSALLLAITWAVLVALVVASWAACRGSAAGRSRAAVAFGVVLVYLAVDVGLVAAGRLGVLGTAIGSDPRYTADAIPVALLFVSAVLPARLPRVGVLVAGVGLAASAVVTLLGPPYAPTSAARTFVTNAAADPTADLYDGPVPAAVLVGWFGAQDRASVVLGALPDPPRFDQPGGDLRMLDDTGTPRPIVLLGAATGRPGPVAGCGYAVTSRVTDVPLVTPAQGGRPVVRIGYYAGSGLTGSVDIGAGPVNVSFQAGVHDLFLVADRPPADVRITASGGTVCVTDVAVGTPLPAGR